MQGSDRSALQGMMRGMTEDRQVMDGMDRDVLRNMTERMMADMDRDGMRDMLQNVTNNREGLEGVEQETLRGTMRGMLDGMDWDDMQGVLQDIANASELEGMEGMDRQALQARFEEMVTSRDAASTRHLMQRMMQNGNATENMNNTALRMAMQNMMGQRESK